MQVVTLTKKAGTSSSMKRSLMIPGFALVQPNESKVTLYVQLDKPFLLGLQHRWDWHRCPEDWSFLLRTPALCHHSRTIPSLSGIEQSRRGFFFSLSKPMGKYQTLVQKLRKSIICQASVSDMQSSFPNIAYLHTTFRISESVLHPY